MLRVLSAVLVLASAPTCIFLGLRGGKLAKCDRFLHVPMRRGFHILA
jgi:hypothetical protein